MKRSKLISACLLVILSACTSGPSGKIRIINANPVSSGLRLVVNESETHSNLAYGEATQFFDVDPGTTQIQMNEVDTPQTVKVFDVDVVDKTAQTIALYRNQEDGISAVNIDDTNDRASDQIAKVKVWNLSPNLAQPSDLHVTESDSTELSDQTRMFTDINFLSATPFIEFAPGAKNFILSPANDLTPSVSTGLSAYELNQRVLWLVLDAPGGGLPLMMTSIVDTY